MICSTICTDTTTYSCYIASLRLSHKIWLFFTKKNHGTGKKRQHQPEKEPHQFQLFLSLFLLESDRQTDKTSSATPRPFMTESIFIKFPFFRRQKLERGITKRVGKKKDLPRTGWRKDRKKKREEERKKEKKKEIISQHQRLFLFPLRWEEHNMQFPKYFGDSYFLFFSPPAATQDWKDRYSLHGLGEWVYSTVLHLFCSRERVYFLQNILKF